MSLPKIDFLVIGTQKGGTTTLDSMLEQHPALFLAQVKELNYFALGGKAPNWQGPGDDRAANALSAYRDDQYAAHFRGAQAGQKLGESSVLYLYSEHAPAAIHAHNPGMKLIAVLRDPVKRAYSAYSHLRRDAREPEADFRTALAQETARTGANWEQLWRYRETGHYGDQIERFLQYFPREQLLLFTTEMLKDLPAVVRQCYEFLGVDPAFQPDYDITMNVSGLAKNQGLNDFLGAPHPLKDALKKVLPLSLGRKIKGWISQRNLTPMPPCPSDVAAELRAYYRPQVDKTERLTGLDLSAWK
ncbi:MAG: sulfotransferase domain-containing protein [Verrucomicrobiota bacterium JB022]|nr:sulfotransferase domain-containing protein [Verrucomicrobiota bacterium JB022]